MHGYREQNVSPRTSPARPSVGAAVRSTRLSKHPHPTLPAPPLQVLLRALRDFNLGKLTSDDTGIFMGLLNDLFPKTLDLVPRAVDKVFEAQCRKSARELHYQGDDMFCLKISQVLAAGR